LGQAVGAGFLLETEPTAVEMNRGIQFWSNHSLFKSSPPAPRAFRGLLALIVHSTTAIFRPSNAPDGATD
jgi:hypothetical protein